MTLDKWIQWEVIYLTRYKLKFRSDTSSPLDIQVTWMVLIYERERCHIDELNASLHRYRVRYHDRTHHPTKIDLPRDPPFTCRNTVATVKCGKNLRGLATITWSDTSSIKLDSRSDCLVVTKFGWTIFNLWFYLLSR